MNRFFFFLSMALVSLINATSQTTISNILAEQEAFSIVMQKYDANKVDVFLLNDTSVNASNQYYTYFIDEEPMKGWEHKCSLATISKHTTPGDSVHITTHNLRMAPSGNFETRHLMPRDLTYASHKPVVRFNPTNDIQQSNNRTQAIILSGGYNMFNNHQRYWNDCSFIYQTLTKRYNVPKENISVIMSDGTDPAPDMRISNTWTFESQPLDLDGDGSYDIQYSATKANIKLVLNDLILKMNEDDHLFIFVIDHGGSNSDHTTSNIWLWNEEPLYDYELAQLLKPFTDKAITVNAVLGQCYAGGFIDDLTEVGCIVATACSGFESSWGCRDIPYDEFVYHWTSAINGEDAFGNIIVSDSNKNGYISMLEAFNFAKNKDRTIEKPLFISTPQSIGETLAFNNIPYTELCILDNFDDKGSEPNLTTDIYWDSSNIWIRNKDDDSTVHQNPEYNPGELTKTVYVKVYNKGTKDYITNTNNLKAKYIHSYWAKASTCISERSWIGKEGYGRRPYIQKTGGKIGNPLRIPDIPAGECATVKIPWTMTENIFNLPGTENPDRHLFSVLAKIKDDGQPEELSDTLDFDPKNSKKIAQKNITILELDGKNATKEAAVFVRNTSNAPIKHSIEIRERIGIAAPNEKSLFDVAAVELTMSPRIFSAWQRGGCKTAGVEKPTEDTPHTFRYTSDCGIISLIDLNPNEFDKVYLKLNIHSRSNNPLGQNYVLDLIQRDEYDHIVGGTTFTYKEPAMLNQPIPILVLTTDNGNVELQALMPEDGMSPEWSDQTNGCIGTGDRIKVKPTKQNDTFIVSALTVNGEYAEGIISLEPTTGIKSLVQELTRDILDVALLSETGSSDSEIIISAIENAEVQLLRQKIDSNQTVLSIDASSLPSGLYVITLSIDGKVIDSVKFNKK